MFDGTGPAVIGTCDLDAIGAPVGGGRVPSGIDGGGMEAMEPTGPPGGIDIGGMVVVGRMLLVGGMLPMGMLGGGIMPGPMLGAGPGGPDLGGDMLRGGGMVMPIGGPGGMVCPGGMEAPGPGMGGLAPGPWPWPPAIGR